MHASCCSSRFPYYLETYGFHSIHGRAPTVATGLALARPGVCVRVLLFDPRAATQSGHRLIELARRLTSRIAIRRVADEDQERLDAFLIVDETGYVHRRLAERLEAIADYADPPAARRLRQDFERLWEHGSVDSELRQLFI